jgi:uncharacterized glyoxalase superfamily protein PhnB
MPVIIEGYETHLAAAVAHYWKTLDSQTQKHVSGGAADAGNRKGVTGGKQTRRTVRIHGKRVVVRDPNPAKKPSG